MNLLLNIVRIIFGGREMAFGWLVTAFFFAMSIVGIPWARAAFNVAIFHLWPFGREIVDREDMFSLPASLRLRLSVFPSPGSIRNWLAWRWHQWERWSSIKMSQIMDATATGVSGGCWFSPLTAGP